jgi:iron complex outermembrane receptor protein
MDMAATIRNPQDVGARDYNSGRFSLLWQPSASFQAKLKVDYNDLDNHGYAFGVVEGIPDGFKTGFLPDANNLSSDPFVVGNNSTDNYAKDRSARGALDLHYTFDNDLVLRSLTGVQWLDTVIRNDDDGSAVMDRRQIIDATFKIYTEELSLVSPETDRFNWILGTFYRKETLVFPVDRGFILTDATHYGPPGVNVQEITLWWNTPRTTEAIFGQASYDITEDLKIQLGLRGQHYINTEVSDLALPVFGIFLPTYFGPANGRGTGKPGYHESTLTGKLALNWQADDRNFLYGFVATGNTTGGVSVVIGNPNFKPQKTTDFEAGWKSQLLDGHVTTQLDAFYDHIKDYQAYFIDPLSGLGTFQNLGTADLYGVEASAQAGFDDLSFDLSVSLIHSELGAALTTDSIVGVVQVKGNKLPYTAPFTFHGGVQYDFHLGDGATLSPRVDYAWVDTQTMTPLDRIPLATGVPIDRVPSHGLLNAKLTYGTEKWNVEVYGTNLTDEIYIEAHGGPGYNAYPNEPRRFGIRAHYNFGD